MAELSETPTNPFSDGSLQSSIREEKVKVLRMIAEKGTEGYAIYDQARQNLQRVKGATSETIGGGDRSAPVSLLKSIAGRHTQHLDTAMRAVGDLRAAEQAYYSSATQANAGFMDAALNDQSGTLLHQEGVSLLDSRGREAESNTRPYDLRARRPVDLSGGGSGGSGSGFVNSGSGRTTIPLGLLGIPEDTPDNRSPWEQMQDSLWSPASKTGGGGSRSFGGGGSRSFGGGGSRTFTSRPPSRSQKSSSSLAAKVADGPTSWRRWVSSKLPRVPSVF